MINYLKPQENIKKQTFDGYKSGELKFKTKEQVERLIDINNNKKGRSQVKTEDLILRLDKDEFFNFLDKESKKQVFTNKKIEYYESLLKRLEELRSFTDKDKFKKYKKIIEEGFEKYCENKNIDYLDYIIENNLNYQNTFNLIKSGNFTINYAKADNNNFYLILKNTKNNKFQKNNLQNPENKNFLEILYKNQNNNVFKIEKQKLFNLIQNEIIFDKYIKGEIRGKQAPDKINEIYDNLDYEMIELLIIKNLIHKNSDLENFKKLLDKLNIERGKNPNNINEQLAIGLKFKINKLENIEKEKKGFNSIISLFDTNPKEAKNILIGWMNKKKDNNLKNFLNYISETRGKNGKKKYNNKNILEKIINQIKNNTNTSKNTENLLKLLNEKLKKVKKSINQ